MFHGFLWKGHFCLGGQRWHELLRCGGRSSVNSCHVQFSVPSPCRTETDQLTRLTSQNRNQIPSGVLCSFWHTRLQESAYVSATAWRVTSATVNPINSSACRVDETQSSRPETVLQRHCTHGSQDDGPCSSFQRLLPLRLSNTMSLHGETCVPWLANPRPCGRAPAGVWAASHGLTKRGQALLCLSDEGGKGVC